MRLRRSCLAVPGSSEKMLAKAATLPADQVFLDLEDAVSPLEKEASRATVVQALQHARLLGQDPRRARERGHHPVVPGRHRRGGRRRRREARLHHDPEGRGRRPAALRRPPADPARDAARDRPPDRHRGPDRERPRHRQPARDRDGHRPHRDDHLRPGRLRGLDRRRPARHRVDRPRLPRRPVALRALEDRHHRPRVRAAGDRRAVHRHQERRRVPPPVPPRPAGRLRRQVGAAPEPGGRRQRGVHAHAGPVRGRPAAARRLPPRHPRSSARARSCTRAR